MSGLKHGVLAAFVGLCTAGAISAQPALTTIQDVLYKADGARFSGTVTIDWNSFQAGDGSNIATQQVTVLVVNGVLKVQLVPTTDASAGANYAVTYNAKGKFQFTETWAVPASATPLRVRDVRVAQGTVVGPANLSTPILISDITGLSTELGVLVPQGVGFVPSRSAVINSSAQLDGASGNPGDCLHVDGSSGPCGSGGGSSGFVDAETPAGILDGVNATFTLANVPSPLASLGLFVNGILTKQNFDYTLSGNAISFLAASIPQPGDTLLATYRLPNAANPTNAVAAQVLCSSAGIGTSSTTLSSLGTCTIPGGMLHSGDRVDIRFNFSHEGASTGLTTQVVWGSTTIFSRAAGPTETLETGKIDAAVNGAGTQWSIESWGATLGFSSGIGTAGDPISFAITIHFLGQMASSTNDTVTLRNFTVVRYPAIANP